VVGFLFAWFLGGCCFLLVLKFVVLVGGFVWECCFLVGGCVDGGFLGFFCVGGVVLGGAFFGFWFFWFFCCGFVLLLVVGCCWGGLGPAGASGRSSRPWT